MDKEEILAKSRKENQNRDLVELEAVNKANDAALTIGILVCILLTALHHTFLHSVDLGVWTVDGAIMSTLHMAKFAKLRLRHELLLGLLYGGVCVFFFVFYLHLTLGVF